MKVWWSETVVGIIDCQKGTKAHWVNTSLFFVYNKNVIINFQDIVMSKDAGYPVVVRINEDVSAV